MNVYKSIMQSLTEAVDYQKGKTSARKTKLTIKPVTAINIDEIKQIHQKIGLSQIVFAGSPSVSSKTAEACGNNESIVLPNHAMESQDFDYELYLKTTLYTVHFALLFFFHAVSDRQHNLSLAVKGEANVGKF